MIGVSRQRENAILKIFQKTKVAIGVVHCLPIPGSPRYDGGSVETIYDRSLLDAEAYVAGGIDGLIIENHGDIPFLKAEALGPETAAVMAVVTDRVRRSFGVPLGINVLANAPMQALAVAKAGSMSSGRRTSSESSSTPRARAATWVSLKSVSRCVGCQSTATRPALGSTCLSNSRRFPASTDDT